MRALLLLLLIAPTASATTWFVRTDGSTTTNCTGTTYAAYPGSGTGQACAYSNLQNAITAAAADDIIEIQANATFDTATPFTLPNVPTSGHPITIRSHNVGSLPGGRVGLANATNMPRIRTTGTGTNAIFTTAANAGYWILDGLELTDNSGTSGDLAFLLDFGVTNAGANNLTVQRCYIHQKESGTTTWNRSATRAIQFEGIGLTFKWNYCPQWAGYEQPSGVVTKASEVLLSVSGSTINVIDNYLDAWYNAIFLSGGDTAAQHTATFSGTPTTTSAVFSSTTGLAANSIVRIDLTGTATISGGVVTRTGGTSIATSDLGSGERGLGIDLTTGGVTVHRQLTAVSGNTWTLDSVPADGSYTFACHYGVRVTSVAGSTVNWQVYAPDTLNQAPSTANASAAWCNGDEGQISDVLFQKNTFNIDTAFAEEVYTHSGGQHPKGNFEIKSCNRMTVDGNWFTGYPAILGFTVRNQNGSAPWQRIKDVTVSNNYYNPANYPAAANGQMLTASLNDNDHNSGMSINFTVSNNLAAGGIEQFVQMSGLYPTFSATDNIQIYHNTIINDKLGITYFAVVTDVGVSSNGYVFRDNIVSYVNYGHQCLAGGGSLNDCWPSGTWSKNVVADLNSAGFSTSTWGTGGILSPIPTAWSQVGFINQAGSNYRLSGGSNYKGAGTGGTDPGINQDALATALGFDPATGLGSGTGGNMTIKGPVTWH